MCAIMGVLDTQKTIDINILKTMQRALYHRGPDDTGLEIFSLDKQGDSFLSNCGVAFDRLSIRDLSMKGHQPMFTEDKSVMIAFNGEIYNSEELRPLLIKQGYSFNSNSDTEVLLKLYHCFGVDKTLSLLDGMFAICLVDFNKETFYLIRDRIGEKPLYLYQDGKKLMFASEYKAFYAHPEFKAEIDDSAVDEYFMFRYTSGEQTFLKGVCNLTPGSYAEITPKGISYQTYWSLPNSTKSNKSFEECKEEIEELIHRSVKRRLISDRPIGCQLSGGVDSSYLCNVVKKKFNKKLKSYCITFANKEFSEEPYIDYVNKQLGLDTKKYRFEPTDFIHYWSKATWFFEAPMNHEGSLALCNLNEKAGKEVTVMLCGDGPDECLGGYSRAYEIALCLYRNHFSILRMKLMIRGFKQKLWKFRHHIKEEKMYSTVDDLYISKSQWIEDRLYKKLRPEHAEDSIKSVYQKRRKILDKQSGEGLRKFLNYEMNTYMQDILMRSDKISMAASIEIRVPYLMPELLEYILSVPDEYMVDLNQDVNHGTKYLLKSLCEDVFGKGFTYRSKMGLSFPFIDYFSDTIMREYIERELMPTIKNRNIVNYDYVSDIWKKIPEWKRSNLYDWRVLHMMWCVFSFEIWAKMYIDHNPLNCNFNGQNIVK